MNVIQKAVIQTVKEYEVQERVALLQKEYAQQNVHLDIIHVMHTTVTVQNVDVHHGDHTEDGVIVNHHLVQEIIHVKPEKFIIRKVIV